MSFLDVQGDSNVRAHDKYLAAMRQALQPSQAVRSVMRQRGYPQATKTVNAEIANAVWSCSPDHLADKQVGNALTLQELLHTPR